MRFIATADWQLGMAAHFLEDAARARYQQARLDAVARIGRLAQEHGAEFVLVGGDVFESNQLDRSILVQAFEAFRTCRVPLVLLPGNHDPLDASSIYQAPLFQQRCPSHVQVLTTSEPCEIIPGVEVIGAPWRSKHPDRDLVAEACRGLEKRPEGRYRLLVGHGAIAALNPDHQSLAAIDDQALSRLVSEKVIDFAVLGDRHSTTQVTPHIWYPGTPEVTSRRETNPGNILLVDLADAAPRVEVLKTGRWSFQVLEETLMGRADVERLTDRLDAIPDKERVALWLVLRGTLSMTDHARLEAQLREREPLFARLGQWGRHTDLAVLPEAQDFSNIELTGFAAAAVAELRERAPEDPSARDALALLYRLVGGGS